MMSRRAKIAVGIPLGLVVLTAVVGGVAVWRLSQGPVTVDFLTPLVETTAADLIPGHKVTIRHTVLAWDRGRGTFDLRTLGVSILDRKGTEIVTLPMIKIGLDLGALVQREIRLTGIAVDKARIHLIRDVGGIVRFGDWKIAAPGRVGGDRKSAERARVFMAILRNLTDPSGPSSPLSRLETIRLTNGEISLDDRMMGNIWKVPLANIELRRSAAGLVGEFQLDFALLNDLTEFRATFSYDLATELVQLAGRISNLKIPVLTALAPGLGRLAGSDLTFGGSFSLSFGRQGRIPGAAFDVTGGPGKLSLGGLLAKPIEVSEVKARGRYDGAKRGFELEFASVSFRINGGSDSTINLTGSARELGGNVLVEARATLDTLSSDDLKSLWPKGLGDRTRDWINKNIIAGTLDGASMTFAANLPDWDVERATITSLNGTFGYRGVEVHYLRPLPPATDVQGKARFDRKSFRLRLGQATVSDLKLTGAEVDFTGSGAGRRIVVTRLRAEGPIRTAYALLDHPRFKRFSGLGIDPAGIGGRVSVAADFAIPLRPNPAFKDIEIRVQGTLTEGSFRNVLFGQNVEHANVAFSLDSEGLTVSGPVDFAGFPVTLTWQEAFAENAPLRREIRAEFTGLGDAERVRLGLKTEPFVRGPLSGSLHAELGRHGTGTATAVLNLEDAELALPFAGWSKAAGEPAKAAITFEFADGRIVALRNVAVEAGTLKAEGSVTFNDAGTEINRMDFARLIFGESNLREVSIMRRGTATEITIGGGVLDARPFLNPYLNGTKAGAEKVPSVPGTAAGTQRQDGTKDSGWAFSLTAPALRRVYLAQDRYLENVALRLNRTSRGWESIQLRSQVPRFLPDRAESEKSGSGVQEPGTFSLRYGPSSEGGRTLSIRATDAGATLRVLNIFEGMRGGDLEIRGQAEGPETDRPIRATIKMENFTIIGAPILARLLTVASLTGIGNLLRGGGLRFSRLVGDFTLDDRVIRTDGIRANGSSIGLLARGEIDLKAGEMNLRGSIVPLYLISRVLGSIPIIGRIIVGEKGGGLLAITYSIKGKFGEPKISVNPASLLTPGILRTIFGKIRTTGSN